MAKLFADEDFSLPVVEELRRFGHDVLTVQEAGQGNRGAKDSEILASAIQEGRVVLSFNRRHFIRLHQQSAIHKGIIVCTRDDDVNALARRIHQAIENSASLENQLLRINRLT